MIGKLTDLDAPTRARIDAACGFLNHKIRQMRTRVKRIAGVAIAAGLAVSYSYDLPIQNVAMSVGLVIALAYAQARREVRRWYKSMVIRRVVEALGHGLTYSHESELTKDQIERMDFVEGRIDTFKSEDQINGRRDNVSFAFHEVSASREEGSGKTRRTVILFKGVFMTLEFNKHFAGHTIVVPDKEGRRLGGFLGEAEVRKSKHIVRLADTAFENIYTAYTTNDHEAHYLLTPKLMELVLHAGRQLRTELRLAFFQNSLYVGIPGHTDRFEVNLFGQDVTPLSAIGDLVDVVALAQKLIDALDLETRIWSRA